MASDGGEPRDEHGPAPGGDQPGGVEPEAVETEAVETGAVEAGAVDAGAAGAGGAVQPAQDQDATSEQPAGVDDLKAELAELQARNAKLERRVSFGAQATRTLRTIAVVLCLVIATVVGTLAVPVIWGRNLVLNTDRYVQTLAPLASDPGVQAGVVKAVDQQVDANLDVKALVQSVLPPNAARLLGGPLESAAQSLVNTVATRFVQSDAFKTLWVTMNRVAHEQLVGVLTGNYAKDQTIISIKNGVVSLDLGPIVDQVKQQLVTAGLTVASKIPAVGATIEIAHVKGITSAQSAVRLLDRLAVWLPLISLLFFAIAIALARRHRRALMISALALAGGMLVVRIGLAIGRSVYLSKLPGTYLTSATAGNVYDTLTRYLRWGLRIVWLVALIIVLLAWLFGPSAPARRMRHWVAVAPRDGWSNWQASHARQVVAANRPAFAIGIGTIAAVLILFWSNPSAVIIWVIVLLAIAGLLLVYLARPAAEAGAPSDLVSPRIDHPVTPDG